VTRPAPSRAAIAGGEELQAGPRADGRARALPLFDLGEVTAIPGWLGKRLLLSLFTTRQQIFFARGYGWLASRLWERPGRTEKDIELILGAGMTPSQRRQIARSHVQYRMQRHVMQYCQDYRVLAPQVSGLEHLDAALAQGKGALVVGPHFGYYEFASRGLQQLGYACRSVVSSGFRHEAQKSRFGRLVHQMIMRLPQPYRGTDRDIVVSDGALAILRALQRNEVVFITLDSPVSDPVTIDVLGVKLQVAGGPMRLSRMSGAPMLTGFFAPSQDGSHIEALIGSPLLLNDSSDAMQAAFDEYGRRYAEAILRFPHAMRWKILRNAKRRG
jgi:lauroyl/myristoyl acyltransferase